MSEQNGTTTTQVDENASMTSSPMDKGKGKGKAVEVPQDVEMEDDEESSEESEAEEPVRLNPSNNWIDWLEANSLSLQIGHWRCVPKRNSILPKSDTMSCLYR